MTDDEYANDDRKKTRRTAPINLADSTDQGAGLAKDWALSSVFMWLDIRACQDANGDGMGDLPGLIRRLDHFQDAGIGALIFPGLQPSDFAYVGTMMTEFCDVDARYGTLADFDRLIAEAHRRQIAILIGWSPYSTHPDHPCFAASRDPSHPRHAEFRDYYLWTDDINTRQPRRWGHWEWDETRGQYFQAIWLTVDKRWCPEVNPLSDRAHRENERVLRFWLERGADGFWVDCGSSGGFVHVQDHVRISREMTALVHSYPDKWIIAEGTKTIEESIARDGYDSFLNGWTRKPPVYETVFRKPGQSMFVEGFSGMEAQGIHEALYSFYDDPGGNQVMNVFQTKVPLDFHDPADVARLKLQFAIHATLPLVPLFVFPQHCGLERVKKKEHVQRFPFLMMWDHSPQHGFTTGKPYLEQNVEGYPETATVEAQLADPKSILCAFSAVMNLRRRTPALQCHDPVADSYARLPTDDDRNCYAYVRRHVASGQAVIVVCNLLGQPRRYEIHTDRSAKAMEMLAGRKNLAALLGPGPQSVTLTAAGRASVDLPAYGFVMLEAVGDS